MPLRKYLFWKNTVPLFLLALSCGSAFGEALRRQERIGKYTYTVEYRLDEAGNLQVEPTQIWTTNGWSKVSDVGVPEGEREALTDPGRVITLGGKSFSVNFSTINGYGAQGSAYAVMEKGNWRYLAEQPATKVPATKKGTVAEFSLNDRALNQFALQLHETNPITKNGNRIQPNVKINITLELKDSQNTTALNFRIGIQGSSTSGGGQAIGKRHFAGAQVQTQVSGESVQEVVGTPDGISIGRLRWTKPIQISPQISTYNSFRGPLLSRLVHRAAGNQASQQVSQQLPQEKRELVAKIHEGATEAIKEANSLIADGLRDISGFSGANQQGALGIHLSSKASVPGSLGRGEIRATLTSQSEKEREPKPTLEKGAEAAMTAFVHEDAVNESVAPLLAGKTISLKEAVEKICQNQFLKRLDVCTSQLDETTQSTKVTFAKEDPIRVSFRDGQVKLEMNAAHDIEPPPGSGKLAMKGSMLKIEISYELSVKGLGKRKVTVSPTQNTTAQKATTDRQAKPAGLAHEISSLIGRAVRAVSDPAEQEIVKKSYESAFKPEAEFSQISLPAKAYVRIAPNRADTNPVVTQNMRFETADAKAEGGWLGLASSLVTESK